jgi:glycosyltransferase involved in cell wall biosynthesis
MASHCYDLAYSLSKNKIFTTVFCGMPKEAVVEEKNPYLEVVRLPCLNIPPRYLWFQIENFKDLIKSLKDFDIIHGVNPLASALCLLFKKKLNKPYVTSIHEVFLSNLKTLIRSPFSEWTLGDLRMQAAAYPINDLLTRMSLKFADHIVVCGRSALNDMIGIYPEMNLEKTSVIYNGIRLDRFKQDDNCVYEENSIIFYGRLVLIKGLLHLVEAISLLKDDLPGLNLTIFGRGPLEGKIRSLIRRFSLAKNVSLQGQYPHDELIKEIKKNSAVVLPSLYEVGPVISGLEAMACKKPLVAFDFPFTRELVLNMHNGVLAKAKDVEDLADKIRLVLSDGDLRKELGQNAYEHVKSRHDWRVLVKKYIEIYDDCLRRRSS